MKKLFQIKKGNNYPPPLYVLLTIAFIMWFNAIVAQPPNYAARYNTPANTTYVYDDNVLITQLEPTTVFVNNHGFVMFKTADNSNTFLNDLIIHAIKDDGTLLGTRRIEFSNNHVVPIACAFNNVKGQYIVTGTARNIFNNQTFDTWYIVLNTGLQVLYCGAFSLQAGLGITMNETFVTDVCPVYNTQGIDFAFTGTILETGINTSPSTQYSQNQAPTDKRLFIATLETTNYTLNTAHYDFSKSGTPVDKAFFPARIIEIPTSSNDGFLVGGTGVSNGSSNDASSIFYLRTDYTLGVYDYKNIDATNFYTGNLMTIGSMYYDHDSDEVLIAGSLRYSSAGTFGFLFDKIMNLTGTSNIQSFSIEPTAWNGQIGIKKLPGTIDGFPKVGHITQKHTSSFINYIGGKIMSDAGVNFFTNNLPVLMNCLYQHNHLMNWSTNQQNDIHYYSRLSNTNTPLQFYVNGYNYDQMWFPTHGTTDLNFAAYNTVQQALTSMDDASDDVVLNLTDNTYDLTNCNEDHFNATLELSNVYTSTQNTVTQQAPTTLATTVGYTYTTLNNPSVDFCDVVFNPFKTIPLENSKKPLIAKYSDSYIEIDCNQEDIVYSLIDLSNRTIKTKKIENNTISISNSEIAKGIYFLRIANDKFTYSTIKISIK